MEDLYIAKAHQNCVKFYREIYIRIGANIIELSKMLNTVLKKSYLSILPKFELFFKFFFFVKKYNLKIQISSVSYNIYS